MFSYRRVTFALTVVVAAVLLAACGGGGSTTGTEPTGETKTTAEDRSSAVGKKIVLAGDVSVPATNEIECEQKKAVEAAGADFEYQFPDEFNAAKQVEIVNALSATQPDVMIIDPDDPTALVTPLKEVAANGTKVVLEQHELTDDSFVSGLVIGDNEALGTQMAEILAEKIGNKKGEVALLGYTPGASSISDAAQKGFKEQIKKYPNLEFIGTTVMKTTSLEEGSQAANALMSSHPNLVGMAADSEYYSIGMAEAIAQRGLKDQIATAQVTSSPKAIQLIKEGVLDGLSSPNWAVIGKESGEAAVAVAAGEEAPKFAPVAPFKITAETVNSPKGKEAENNPGSPC